jgi:hypothetical protein
VNTHFIFLWTHFGSCNPSLCCHGPHTQRMLPDRKPPDPAPCCLCHRPPQQTRDPHLAQRMCT